MARVCVFYLTFLTSLKMSHNNICVINMSENKEKNLPLILQNAHFLYPTSVNDEGQSVRVVQNNQTVTFSCQDSTSSSPSFFHPNNDSIYLSSELTTQCIKGHFEKEKLLSFKDMKCTKRNKPRLEVLQSNELCGKEGADGRVINSSSSLLKVLIGWNLTTSFESQVEVCVDNEYYATLWTSHSIDGTILDFHEFSSSRPSFSVDVREHSGHFFGNLSSSQVLKFYTKKEQRARIYHILNTTQFNGEEIIDSSGSGSHYLAKGHLSPDGDFITSNEQDATYYLINVAPQFQSFNNGNWKALEIAIRKYAKKKRSVMRIINGTYGILKYYNKTITLLEDKLPVPLYFWKVLLNVQKNESVVFLGYNDPHACKAPDLLCLNICHLLPWVNWNLENINAGYMYCCHVQDLKTKIVNLPNIIGNLLTT